MKKLFSLAMVMIMALALCVPAMAAGNDPDGIGAADDATGSITIGNPTQKEDGTASTYKAYKIFDVTYTGVTATAGNYAYTIETDSPWYPIVEAYVGAADNGLTLVPSVNATDKTVVVEYDLAKFSAAKFAAHLKSNIPNGAPAEDFTNNVADELELGF